MARLLFAQGARGQAIEAIQNGLRFEARDVDGRYGGQTRDGVAAFQRARDLAETGQVDDVTWDRLLSKPVPPVFERCLALTAAFEGHGFSLAEGNFDGAGITWGIVGYTLEHGDLAKIVFAVDDRNPDLVRLAFEDRTEQLLEVLVAPLSRQLAFADSISIPPANVRLAEPWRSAFDLFGKLPEVRLEQIRCARDVYFAQAERTAERFGLQTELGVALAFDIQVQNGGIKKTAAHTILNAPKPRTERALRRLIADAVADAARSAFREDVRARKRAIADHTGVVHGESFDLLHWGLAELPVQDPR